MLAFWLGFRRACPLATVPLLHYSLPCVCLSLQCEWTIQCGVGYSHVSLLFSRVETEEDYDEVAVYEGDQASDAAELSRLSGHNIPPTTVETAGRTALIQFTSDEDVAGDGREGIVLTVLVELVAELDCDVAFGDIAIRRHRRWSRLARLEEGIGGIGAYAL